jgi:hypothetical protein
MEDCSKNIQQIDPNAYTFILHFSHSIIDFAGSVSVVFWGLDPDEERFFIQLTGPFEADPVPESDREQDDMVRNRTLTQRIKLQHLVRGSGLTCGKSCKRQCIPRWDVCCQPLPWLQFIFMSVKLIRLQQAFGSRKCQCLAMDVFSQKKSLDKSMAEK